MTLPFAKRICLLGDRSIPRTLQSTRQVRAAKRCICTERQIDQKENLESLLLKIVTCICIRNYSKLLNAKPKRLQSIRNGFHLQATNNSVDTLISAGGTGSSICVVQQVLLCFSRFYFSLLQQLSVAFALRFGPSSSLLLPVVPCRAGATSRACSAVAAFEALAVDRVELVDMRDRWG